MNKQELSERDICTKYIVPALESAGWDRMLQLREEFEISRGRIIARGKMFSQGRPRRADIVLCYKPNIPIAVIEAKSNRRKMGAGMQQALDYAEKLKVPFAITSNGDGFILHDRTGHADQTETSLHLSEFPGPDELWARYRHGRIWIRSPSRSSSRIVMMTGAPTPAARLQGITSTTTAPEATSPTP